MNNPYENENQVAGNDYTPPTVSSVENNDILTQPVAEPVAEPIAEPIIEPIVEHTAELAPEEPVVTSAQNEQPPTQASPVISEQRVPEWSFRRHPDHINETRAPAYREPTYRVHDTAAPNMYTPGLNIYGYPSSYPRRRATDFIPQEPPKKQKSKVGGFFRALCLVLVCALFSAGATYAVMEYRYRAGYHTQITQVVLGGPAAGGQDNSRTTPVISSGDRMTGAEIYQMALPQVVGISIDVPTTGFFGNVSTSTAAGSGFIISTDGYILTNHHVIEPGLQDNLPINVTMYDGTQYIAQVVGYEVANDVALIKIDADELSAATLADFGTVEPGQRIYAIGNPLGSLHHTMTAGVVSAVGRTVTVEGTIINAFQFDAAVNRGNSGGPIYNENGEVIGIVTAKLARSDVEGIGFAIPIIDAIEIASGLIEHGYIIGRPLLGIVGATVSAAIAEYYEWVVGAQVRGVSPGTAAESAGLEPGDIIVGLGGTQVTSMDTLRFAMRSFRAGDTTTISVWRLGYIHELEVTFDEDMEAGQPGRTT